MAEAWTHKELGDFLTLQRGFDITKEEQRPGPYPVISSSGPSSHHDEARVKGPGVVIGRKGSLGGVYYSESDFWPHDTTLWVKDFKGNDPLFTYYFLKTLGLERFDVGAANPTLNRNHLHLLPISAPSVATQHKIAVVLAAYDELIKSNLRRIEILEEMAQAVYREWFVNFRIPGYEDVALVDSPLGPIPRGWELGTLEAIVENVRASTKAGPHLDELPYVPIDCIRARSFTLRESKRGAEAKSSLILFKESDILFGAMRPYFHKVAIAPGEGVTRTTCFVLRPRMRTWRSFALLTMFRDETIAYATNHSRGTTIPYASWDGSLAAMTICTPTDGLLERFDTEVTPMLELARNLARQNANLQATRDLLLPRLVSGEIDVLGLDIDTEWLAS